MPTGVYKRTPCAPDCACKKHAPEARARALAGIASRGRTPWNKGLKGMPGHPHTDESRQKIGAAQRGIHDGGDTVGIGAVHARLRTERGTPSVCKHCGTTTARRYDWAFTGDDHQNGGFSLDLNDYIRLCRSCHLRFDKALA